MVPIWKILRDTYFRSHGDTLLVSAERYNYPGKVASQRKCIRFIPVRSRQMMTHLWPVRMRSRHGLTTSAKVFINYTRISHFTSLRSGLMRWSHSLLVLLTNPVVYAWVLASPPCRTLAFRLLYLGAYALVTNPQSSDHHMPDTSCRGSGPYRAESTEIQDGGLS